MVEFVVWIFKLIGDFWAIFTRLRERIGCVQLSKGVLIKIDIYLR